MKRCQTSINLNGSTPVPCPDLIFPPNKTLSVRVYGRKLVFTWWEDEEALP